MTRRRWVSLAAACLVTLAVLLAAARGGAAQRAGAPMPAPRRSGTAARVATFDAAVATTSVARCKKQQRNRAGAPCARLPGGEDDYDDDKRVVPTGSNPLHNL